MVVFSKYSYDEELGKVARKEMDKVWPPAIPFMNKNLRKKLKEQRLQEKDQERKNEKSVDDEDDEVNFRTLKVPLDPNDLANTAYMNVKSRLYEDGEVEEWIKWCKHLKDLYKMYGLEDDDPKRGKIMYGLLKGEAADWYVSFYRDFSSQNEGRTNKWTEDQILKRVQWYMSCRVFDRHVKSWSSAARKQKSYMRKSLFMGELDPEDFLKRLKELNEYLCYFPVEGGNQKYSQSFVQG